MFNIFLHGYDGLQTDSISTSTSQIFSIRMDHNGSIWRSDVTDEILTSSNSNPATLLRPRNSHWSWLPGAPGFDSGLSENSVPIKNPMVNDHYPY